MRKDKREAFWGVTELVCSSSTFVTLGILNWHYIILPALLLVSRPLAFPI